jgi:hypothetical protein
MAEYFWTSNNGLHECWRMAEDVPARSYQLVGECQRDLKEGGFKAARYKLPEIFPETARFASENEARQWVVDIQQ